MKVYAVAVCVAFSVAMVSGLMNNRNGLNNFNGLNLNNMNNMNNMNNFNGMNMNNWNGLNMNRMNNNNWNMNRWNGMNGMGRLGGGMMNGFNGLNTNMRNINGGRDDPRRLSEGILDDATSVSHVTNLQNVATHPVAFVSSGDYPRTIMTSSNDGFAVMAMSADDPTEGHVVFANTDNSGMHKTDI